MRKYADYEFYINEFHGKMSLEAFEAAVIPASAYIRRATLGRSEGCCCEELKYACSAVSDAYNDIFNVSEESGAHSTKGIKSENTDGYSVTYVTEFADGTTKEEAFRSKAIDLLKLYLANTGLLCPRVGAIR